MRLWLALATAALVLLLTLSVSSHGATQKPTGEATNARAHAARPTVPEPPPPAERPPVPEPPPPGARPVLHPPFITIQPVFFADDGTVWPFRTGLGCVQLMGVGSTVDSGTTLAVYGRMVGSGFVFPLGDVVYTSGPFASTAFRVKVLRGITEMWVQWPDDELGVQSNHVWLEC